MWLVAWQQVFVELNVQYRCWEMSPLVTGDIYAIKLNVQLRAAGPRVPQILILMTIGK